jgi:hypothetical protein
MTQQLFLGQNMVRTMYLQIGSIISGRGTQVIRFIFWDSLHVYNYSRPL